MLMPANSEACQQKGQRSLAKKCGQLFGLTESLEKYLCQVNLKYFSISFSLLVEIYKENATSFISEEGEGLLKIKSHK